MKVMIEIDLPEGQKIPDAKDIVRLTNPDWLASWWHISDIQDCATGWGEENEDDEITDDEAREVLRLLDKYHDCEVGICWDVISGWIDEVKEMREKA
jgi:hypothetical protein